MTEDELRKLAATARTLLGLLIRDEAERRRVGQELDRALTLPTGQGVPELIDALSGHPALQAWTLEHAPWLRESHYMGESVSRYLALDAPESVPTGHVVSIHAQIMLKAPPGWTWSPLEQFDVPPEGATVVITVSARGLTPLGDLQHDVRVPAAGDSAPVLFTFAARREGLHTVLVRAYWNGTYLGEVSTQISVEGRAQVKEGHRQNAVMGRLTNEPGELTLEVDRTDNNRYWFRLLGDGVNAVELSRSLAGDPSTAVNNIIEELCRLAAGRSADQSEKSRRDRLRSLGADLWGDAVPGMIRQQFWENQAKISSFTVASDADLVPWELLYCVDGGNEAGFLVEQFPVLRRVPGQERARSLTVHSAAFVVPPGSPANARDEVSVVRRHLGNGVAVYPNVQDRALLKTLLEDAPPSLLHFSCHNDYHSDVGSAIRLNGGWLDFKDLGLMVGRRSLEPYTPLVFFNACRTAGEIPGLLNTMSWARRFMAAGAGVFVGTLWAIRSSSAKTFADEFYRRLLVERLPLGRAASEARQKIVAEDGDPTWLAYSIYGNPAATVSLSAANDAGQA